MEIALECSLSLRLCKRIKHKDGKLEVSTEEKQSELGGKSRWGWSSESNEKVLSEKDPSSHDIPKHCGVSLWLQMLKQTPRSINLGIVYSSRGLQTHHAQAVPAALPLSPCGRCAFSSLITRWGSGFYLAASLYLHPFHSRIRRNMRERQTESEREGTWKKILPDWNCKSWKDWRKGRRTREKKEMRM